MTHLVCGYPNLSESWRILNILSKYSEYIEIQFPFSDPIADWPLISKANEISLKWWTTTKKCFEFIEKNISKVESKLLIMTYYNIVFNYWVEQFIKKTSDIWVNGLIIPDVPFDEWDWIKLIELCKKYNINLIQIVSPIVKELRLEKISNISSWFVYAVSQNMTTWSNWIFESEFREYIKKLKKYIKIDIWVWFWVKTKNDIEKICSVSNFAVIWSQIIKVYDNKWIVWISEYFEELLV